MPKSKYDFNYENDDERERAESRHQNKNLHTKALKELARERKKAERFITIRMWISLIMSKFFNDRGTIPKNIGNNVLITNNQYITKNHMSMMIIVREMAEITPIMWMSDIVDHVKESVKHIVVDVTVKMLPYMVDTSESGMNSRLRNWKNTMDNPLMPKDAVRRAARCLYTYDVLKTGVTPYKGYTFITLRAKNSLTLKKGVNAACDYLERIGASYRKIENNIEENLLFTALMSSKRPEHLKDFAPVIFSIETMAESLPGVQGMNNLKGVLFGQDIISQYPYQINLKATSNAKNFIIEANSGFGKTFIVESWLYSFYADDFNLCIMDIKGTEFGALTKALHGITISLRHNSPYYINTFMWRQDECFGREPYAYANEQRAYSKEKMMVMANVSGEEVAMTESLIEEFLQFVYDSVGARPDNMNTWPRTERLTPYVVFEMFETYISHEIQNKYPRLAKKVLERLRIYMSHKGTGSRIFDTPISYKDLLDTKVIRFDFGILEEVTDEDPVVFKLHVRDMSLINDAFVAHKKQMHEWTCKVLEESQVVGDYLMNIYSREITLGRARNQVTLLLGNSIMALQENKASKAILENMNVLVLGSLNKSSRKYLIEEFGLKDDEHVMLEDIQVNSDLDHTFLFINRMEKNSTTALVQAAVPSDVANSSLFRVVDTE